MTNPGVLVSNTGISIDPYKPDVNHHFFRFTDNYGVAVWGASSGTYYAIRNTSGAWAAPVQWSATNAFDSTHINCASWYPSGAGSELVTMYVYDTVAHTLTPWNFGWQNTTHTTTGASVYTAGAYTVTGLTVMDMFYDTANTHLHLVYNWTSGGSVYLSIVDAYNTGINPPNATRIVSGTASYSRVRATGTTPQGIIYVTVANDASGITGLYPITRTNTNPPVYTIGALETAHSKSLEHATELDANSNLDLVFFDSTAHTIFTKKRTGNNLYSTAAILNSNTVNATSPAISYDSGSGALWVFQDTAASQANGEVVVEKRSGGSFGATGVIAGNDSGGYNNPSTGRFTDSSGNVDLLYIVGNNPYSLYYYQVQASSAPSTPTPLAPTGNVGGLTPSFSWTYTNVSFNDLQFAYEIHVTRVSDSVVMWDSGKVTSGSASGIVYGATSNVADGNYIAPVTLAYGIQYQWQVKVWDTTLNAPSSYSSNLTFTPQDAPRPSIMAVIDSADGTLRGSASSTLNGSTLANATSLTVQTGLGASFTNGQQVAVGVSPNIDLVTISGIAGDVLTVGAMTHAHSNGDPVVQAGINTVTIGTNILDIQFEQQQTSAHAISSYRVTILDSTGTVVIQQTPVTALTPNIAAAASYTTPDFTYSLLSNSSTYKLKVTVTDATTGISADSPLWTVITSWTAPTPATGFSAINKDDLGYVLLTWTNSGGPSSVNVLRRPAGGATWTTLSSGTVISTLKDFPPLNIAYDYGIQIINSFGIASTTVTYNAVTLGMKYGGLSVWLNDTTAPLTNNVALGGMDTGATTTNWKHNEDVLSFVPMGRSAPIRSYGLADYWTAVARTYFVPASMTGGPGSTATLGSSVISTLRSLNANHTVLLHRDFDLGARFVTLDNLQVQRDDSGINWVVIFDLTEVSTGLSPVVA